MEIVGNDNRVRALFSEIKVADVQAAPSFTCVWHHAETGILRPQRSFSFSLAAVTALVGLTVLSVAVWSTYLNRSETRYQVFAELKATGKVVVPDIRAAVDNSMSRDQKPLQHPVKSRPNRSVIRNQSFAKSKNAKPTTIDSWQSPTAALLTSPADGLFKSLPQLNENANELKSFLPGRINEKEK